MRLLVVIVNYRTAGLTVDCLASLAGEVAGIDASVVVTDNLSGDDSVDRIRAAIHENDWRWATVMPLERNGGFAYGNNAGIRPALDSGAPPDFVLLLNPDTVVRPGALNALLQFMQDNPKVGIAGSRLEHPDGTPQRSAFRFHSVASEFESGMRLSPVSKLLKNRVVAPPVPEAPCQTDWVAGASMIIRREVFRDIGPLDEGYFMYFEEVDFCLRARRADWPCWYVPQSRVVHLVGQASGVTDVKRARKRRPRYWFASRQRFFAKNFGAARAFAANIAWTGAYGLFRLRGAVQRKAHNDPAWLLWDFVRYSFMPGCRSESRSTAKKRTDAAPVAKRGRSAA